MGIGGAVGVGGGGGVGKSLLAIHYARTHYADRSLYVSLDSGSARSRIVGLSLALGLSFSADHTDSQISRLLRDALARFDGLLILDNAEDATEVRMLLPSPPGKCKVVITARDQTLLRSVTGVDPVVLDLFSPEQTRECFVGRLREDRVAKEADDVAKLADMLGYLPVAVDVAAATIADERLPVSTWIEAYPDERKQLDALAQDPADDTQMSAEEVRRRKIVRAVLRLSLRGLTEQGRGLLHALSCFDSATGGPASLVLAVAQTGSEGEAGARFELNRLHQRSILQKSTPGEVGGQRYTVHRLLREVARQEAGDVLKSYENSFFDVFASFPEFLSWRVSDNQTTLAIMMFHREAGNLDRVARVMAGEAVGTNPRVEGFERKRSEFAVHVAQFAALTWPLDLRANLINAAVDDARDGGWRWLEAYGLIALGVLEMGKSRLAEARNAYEAALPLFREIDDGLAEANTLRRLGDLEILEGRLEEARSRYAEALPLFRAVESRLGEANALMVLGDLEERQDRFAEARGRNEEALALFREIEDRLGEANTLMVLGNFEMRQGRLAEARSGAEEALALFLELKDRLGEANTRQVLAIVDSMEKNVERAEQGFGECLQLREQMEDRLGIRADLGYLGVHHMRHGQPHRAALAFHASLEVLPRDGDPVGYAISLRGNLDAFAELGDVMGVLACLRLLADIGERPEEQYVNLLESVKAQLPENNFTALQTALTDDADSVRRSAVQRLRETVIDDAGEPQ